MSRSLLPCLAALGLAAAEGCSSETAADRAAATSAPPESRSDRPPQVDAEAGLDAVPPCEGACPGTEPEPARDLASDGGVDVSADGGSACTSGTTWSPGPSGSGTSPLMYPGRACGACHASQGGPSTALAGTVYPSLHEPDACVGAHSPGLRVIVVDAAGKTHTLPVNASGNFLRVTPIPLPYRAMVVDGTRVRAMKTPQVDGDCNGCHSETGSGAPGRVQAP